MPISEITLQSFKEKPLWAMQGALKNRSHPDIQISDGKKTAALSLQRRTQGKGVAINLNHYKGNDRAMENAVDIAFRRAAGGQTVKLKLKDWNGINIYTELKPVQP